MDGRERWQLINKPRIAPALRIQRNIIEKNSIRPWLLALRRPQSRLRRLVTRGNPKIRGAVCRALVLSVLAPPTSPHTIVHVIMKPYNEARRRAMENATMLWSITEVPDVPSENAAAPDSSGRKLPFDREKQLADDLAFIASMEDNPSQVMAIGIEEHPNGDGMTVRVATNTGSLVQTVRELQTITDTMVQASYREMSRDEVKRTLFERIARICCNRILSRLRSKHAATTRKTEGKPKFPPLLLGTVLQCLRLVRGRTAMTAAAKTRKQSEQLNEVFSQLEDCHDHNSVIQFIEQLLILAHEFDTAALIATLRHCPALDPSLQKYLPEAMHKLGRYYRVAINLTSAARTTKCSLFSKVVVVAVQPNKIDTGSLIGGVQSFDAVWSRVASKNSRNCSSKPPQANNAPRRYSSGISGSGTQWKVHAEIQILLFYEFSPQQFPPRVICASKSACFLCNMFFRVYGKVEVPRTHGRIYVKWALPDYSAEQSEMFHSITAVVERFSEALETRIRAVLGQKRTGHPPPNESVVGLYEPWSSNSTIRQRQPTSTDTVSPTDSHTTLLNGGQASQSTCNQRTDETDGDLKDDTQSPPSSVLTSPTRSSSVGSDSTLFANPGEHICKEICDGECFNLQTRMIHFEFSWSEDPTHTVSEQPFTWSACPVVIECHHGSSEAINQASKTCMIDLDALQPGRDLIVSAGAAFPSTKIVCKSRGQEVGISFGMQK